MAIESTKQLYDYFFRRLEVYDERERRQITEIVLEYFLDVDRTSILVDSAIEPVSDELKQDFRNVAKRINALEPVRLLSKMIPRLRAESTGERITSLGK